MDSFAGHSLGERVLVVGIDFGTTFSGLSWAETRRSDHQSVVESWPASIGTKEGTSAVKVPTELRYTPQGIEWGFQIPANMGRHKWFKLTLAEGKVSKPDGQQKKTPDRLVTDYLSELMDHLVYTLEQKIGEAILRTIPVEFCLTVPAIWSEAAKEKTLKACRKAGLKSKAEILLVSEPEAAAIYAIHSLDAQTLNIGDTFILCDAGGGTVDLISYTIIELHPIVKVMEAAAGTGGLCGSTFLNRRFGEFLEAKLGNLPGWESELLDDALERFDSVASPAQEQNIKKQYLPSTSDQDGYTILLPGLANDEKLGIRRGRMTVTAAEMKEIFEPVVGKVVKLVDGQIHATKSKITAVLLVGGFGQNNYLKERLRSSFKDLVVLQPTNAQTAVVRGAVMMGLARSNSKLAAVGLVSRAARKHYGIELSCEFEEGEHDKTQKWWCSRDHTHKISAMFWIIKKGDPVGENKPIEITFIEVFLVSSGRPTSTTLDIYCDERTAIAPMHRNHNVQKLVTLHADLSHLSQVNLNRTIQYKQDNQDYYCIDGAIEATFSSASTKYVLLLQGKRYDTVTAEYA